MSKKQFTEHELESLLREMPQITDRRSRDEVYRAVLKKTDDHKTVVKRKRFFWPAVASIAAMFLMIILGSSLLSREDNLTSMDQAQLQQEKMPAEQTEEEIAPEDDTFIVQERMDFEDRSEVDDSRTAIYADTLQDGQMTITLNMPDRIFQNVIPVSVVVQEEAGKTWLDHFLEISTEIHEEELGFTEYYPLQGTFTSVEDGILTLNLDHDHPYTAGLTSEIIFFRTLDALRYQGISEVRLFVAGKPGLQLHHEDAAMTVYEIAPYERVGYWLYETEQQVFLTPGPHPYKTISETFAEMKLAIATHELEPSIPKYIDFKVEEESPDTLAIQFAMDTNLLEEQETIYMLEAMLLTAKEFGFKEVRFRNTGQNELFGWDFSQPIAVPVAPNRIQLTNE